VENEKTEIKSLMRMVELLKDRKIIGTVINKSGVFSIPKTVYKKHLKSNPAVFQDLWQNLGLPNFQISPLFSRPYRRRSG
jgi:hypothetical protein